MKHTISLTHAQCDYLYHLLIDDTRCIDFAMSLVNADSHEFLVLQERLDLCLSIRNVFGFVEVSNVND